MTIKISQLPNVAVYSDGILIPIVDSSTGTPTTTKATGGALKNFILGNIQQDMANINANITTANIGMVGYVTAVSSAANVGMKGYVDLQFLTANTAITNSNTGLKGYIDSLTTTATANIAMKGYVDQANTIQSAQIASANVGIIGYINQANTIQSAQISSANIGIIGYVDAVTTAWTANAYQQQALIGNLQSSAYSNANIISYLGSTSVANQVTIPGANISFAGISNLVATSLFALTSSVGNLTVVSSGNIVMNGGYLFGNLRFANGLVLNSSIVNIENNVIAANIGLKGYVDQANTIQSAQIGAANLAITAANVGMRGYVDNQTYSNVNVTSYLPTYSGNVANVTVSGTLGVFGNVFVSNTYTPALANSTGTVGQITWNTNYIYICVASNTWKRANIATW